MKRGGAGRELCDVLAIFGRDVIVFSDKRIEFQTTATVELAWSRWYRKAIDHSTRQLVGAATWIRERPDRVFRDKACRTTLPVSLPHGPDLRIHHVAVVGGAHTAVRNYFGGGSSGSLMIDTGLRGLPAHTRPFCVGNALPEGPFVHIFDERGLRAVLSEVDTARDFIAYLLKREQLLGDVGRVVTAPGEEELIAAYMAHMDGPDDHGFGIPGGPDAPVLIRFPEGGWTHRLRRTEYIAKKNADHVSYLWDALIEQFVGEADHAMVPGEDPRPLLPEELEAGVRYMASEGRFQRRLLGHSLNDLLANAQPDRPFVRHVQTQEEGGRAYVFLLFPHREDVIEAEYRRMRATVLPEYCYAAKVVNPCARFVIGIAMNPPGAGGSEDLFVLDTGEWTEADIAAARATKEELGLFHEDNVRLTHTSAHEYPRVTQDTPQRESRKALAASNAKKAKEKRKAARNSRRRNRGRR